MFNTFDVQPLPFFLRFVENLFPEKRKAIATIRVDLSTAVWEKATLQEALEMFSGLKRVVFDIEFFLFFMEREKVIEMKECSVEWVRRHIGATAVEVIFD